MRPRVLSFPAQPKAATAKPAQAAAPMHCRFEARRLSAFVLGPRPRVRILQIAWLEKEQHISRFLQDYYAEHGCLPRGRHDLGATAAHGLRIGVLDFGRMREQMRQSLRPGPGRRWRWQNVMAFFG